VGAPLVAVRADQTDPELSVPGEYTFYGSQISWIAADNRQALGSAFGARYLKTAQFATPTSFVVWRDPKVKQLSFVCGAYPSWYKLAMEEFVAFNEQEGVTDMPRGGRFSAAAQKRTVTSLALPYASGWAHLDLDHTVPLAPPEDPQAGQAWVFVIQDATGGFSTAHPAVMTQTATESTHFQVLP
jgi:hypothetical protein